MTKPLTVEVRTDLIERAEALAKFRNCSIDDIVRRALVAELLPTEDAERCEVLIQSLGVIQEGESVELRAPSQLAMLPLRLLCDEKDFVIDGGRIGTASMFNLINATTGPRSEYFAPDAVGSDPETFSFPECRPGDLISLFVANKGQSRPFKAILIGHKLEYLRHQRRAQEDEKRQREQNVALQRYREKYKTERFVTLENLNLSGDFAVFDLTSVKRIEFDKSGGKTEAIVWLGTGYFPVKVESVESLIEQWKSVLVRE